MNESEKEWESEIEHKRKSNRVRESERGGEGEEVASQASNYVILRERLLIFHRSPVCVCVCVCVCV